MILTKYHKTINNIVFIADLHCGSLLGLHPPTEIILDEGRISTPSKLQRKVWRWWELFWGEEVPLMTHGEPFAVVVNGDALEGSPHQSIANVSDNLADQSLIAKTILDPIKKMCATDKNGQHLFFMIRGTESHVGKSGQEEERLARELKAIPDEINQHSRYEMFIRMGEEENSGLIHVKHHIGVTSSTSYMATRPNRDYVQAIYAAARWGFAIPDIFIRSHRHQYVEFGHPKKGHKGKFVVTPGWQLKTPFVHKITDDMPEFGGVVVRYGEEVLYTREKIWTIDRIPEVVI